MVVVVVVRGFVKTVAVALMVDKIVIVADVITGVSIREQMLATEACGCAVQAPKTEAWLLFAPAVTPGISSSLAILLNVEKVLTSVSVLTVLCIIRRTFARRREDTTALQTWGRKSCCCPNGAGRLRYRFWLKLW